MNLVKIPTQSNSKLMYQKQINLIFCLFKMPTCVKRRKIGEAETERYLLKRSEQRSILYQYVDRSIMNWSKAFQTSESCPNYWAGEFGKRRSQRCGSSPRRIRKMIGRLDSNASKSIELQLNVSLYKYKAKIECCVRFRFYWFLPFSALGSKNADHVWLRNSSTTSCTGNLWKNSWKLSRRLT